MTPSEETNPATILILDFWPLDPRDNKFLMLKLMGLCFFAPGALADSYAHRSDSNEMPVAGSPLTHTTPWSRAELGYKRVSQTPTAYSLLRLIHRPNL